MTIGTSVEAIGIGSRFDPRGNDYLADSYPFMAEARGATPIFPQDAFADEARLISVVADRDATSGGGGVARQAAARSQTDVGLPWRISGSADGWRGRAR